jgi:membrane protein implicated in regulation of membrane protease activity
MWLLLGFVLLLLELMTPGGFFIFFFGIGGIIVGLLAVLQLAGPPWMQWLLFGAFSAGGLLLVRKPLQNRMRGAARSDVDSIVGETAVAMTDIPVREIGQAELRGTVWRAQNHGDKAIAAGQRCRVVRVEGLMLYVRE